MGELRKVQLTIATPGGDSTQPDGEESVSDPWTPNGALLPPLDLDGLAGLTKTARIRRSCIAAVVLNTVGLGYSMRVKDGHEENITDVKTHTREARDKLDALAKRDKRLKRPSFARLMRAIAWDRQEVGNGYLEVSRQKTTGEIDGLFHAPGKRVRRKKGGGWLVLNKAGGGLSDAVSYYDFGAKVEYDENGKPQPKLAEGATRWNVNELVPLQLYTSETPHYGLPPDASLTGDYLADLNASQTNINFFDSKGVPPSLIFVQGEEVEEGEIVRIEVPEKFVKQIANTLRSSSAREQRVAVIGVPSGFKAQVESLAVTSERDLGYVNFRGDVRRAVLAGWRLSPVFVADIEDAGRYTAEVERQLTKEQVFDPEQEEIAELLDFSIVAELFPSLRIEWDEMRIAGDEVQRQSAIELAELGRITNGELRAAHGFPPLPEAARGSEPKDGEVEFGWAQQLIEPGLGIHGGGVDGGTGKGEGAGPNGNGKPLRAGAVTAPPLPRSPEATFGSIVKSEEERLEDALRTEFDAHVEDAIHMLHDKTGVVAEPVVVERQGDSIVIAPFAGNGNGHNG